jgi:ATP-dependent Clp protease adaptor protein ClpS
MSKKQLANKRGQWQCILANDDTVHVDHVIHCLMDVCAHNYIQAVQCASIVHHTGTCSIFVDIWEECKDVQAELEQLGLKVIVTKYKKYG